MNGWHCWPGSSECYECLKLSNMIRSCIEVIQVILEYILEHSDLWRAFQIRDRRDRHTTPSASRPLNKYYFLCMKLSMSGPLTVAKKPAVNPKTAAHVRKDALQ